MSFRILHIEDDKFQTSLVEMYLEKHLPLEDYIYCAVPTLKEAVKKLEEGCLDIILIDLHLPDALGVDSVQAVKTLCPNTPTVILTGDDSVQTAKDTVIAGADAYVLKGEMKSLPLVLVLTAERYYLKQELQARCNLYDSIVNISPDYIVRFRPNGTVTFANKSICTLMDKTLDDVVGTNLKDYITDKFLQTHNTTIEKITQESPITDSIETKLKDRWVLWRKVGIFSHNGTLTEIQAIGRDVTYRHQQAEEFLSLAQAEVRKMSEQLARSTEKSHQILRENAERVESIRSL